MNRGDADAGGVADLQTDIMRFMAILALCLVAIFALVQSIPLMPTPVEPVAVPESEPVPVEIETLPPEPVLPPPVVEEPVAALVDAPVESPVETITAEAPQEPVEEPVETVTETPVNAPTEEGFSLRFESDLALTRLVARNEVGLYAIGEQRSFRMSVNRGSFSFWPASAPNQYHEMDPATVPDTVVTALRRSGSLGTDPSVKWGVTLPATMRQQLDGYLAEFTSGALVIEPDGNLRLER